MGWLVRTAAKLAIAVGVAVLIAYLVGNWATTQGDWWLAPLLIEWTRGEDRGITIVVVFGILVLLFRGFVFGGGKE